MFRNIMRSQLSGLAYLGDIWVRWELLFSFYTLTLMWPGTQVLIPYIWKVLYKLYRKPPI
jgi:hypothetical protein